MAGSVTVEPGQVWRQEDDYLVKVVAVTDTWVWVRAANGRGRAWQVQPAWFDHWEMTSSPLPEFVVQVWNGRRWAKVRGPEGGPWNTRDRAERIAAARARGERRSSSTEGMPHRVVQR